MRAVIQIIAWLSIMMLASCVNHHTMVKTSGEFAACKIACQQRLSMCTQVCHNNCRACSVNSSCTSAKHYKKYINGQCVQGKGIARDLDSYRDPLQCRKTTCECPADYNVCIQSCAGVIQKRLQVAPICC